MKWNSLNTLRLRANDATGISGLVMHRSALREHYSLPN
jgi:hypothetical protein